MQWLLRFLFALFAALVVGGLCLAIATFITVERLTEPAPASIANPASVGLANAETVEIPSASGSTLHGWWIAGRPGAGAIVLMHGVRSNRLSLVARARKLSQQGYAVLLFDFQAHGESPGARITFGKLEALDAAAAVRFVRFRAPGERIGAIGQSLGGAAALLGDQPLPVDALILEAVYPDIGSAIGDRLGARFGAALGSAVADLLAPVWRRSLVFWIGVDPSALRPIDRIGSVGTPVLVASGERDDRTRIEEARAMFDRAREPKSFWEVPGARHVDLESFARDAYWREVTPFIETHLRRGGERRDETR